MSLRLRALAATVFLLAVASAGALVILGNLRDIVENQQLIVFKDEVYHDQERARQLIQSAQSRLYQHQSGYTREIDRIVEDIASFETIMAGIGPHYRQHYRERDCRGCHDDQNFDYAKQSRRAAEVHQEGLNKSQTCIDCHKGIAHRLPNVEQSIGTEKGGATQEIFHPAPLVTEKK